MHVSATKRTEVPSPREVYVGAVPQEQLLTRFLSQMEQKLMESENLDDFRGWVREHTQRHQVSLSEVPRHGGKPWQGSTNTCRKDTGTVLSLASLVDLYNSGDHQAEGNDCSHIHHIEKGDETVEDGCNIQPPESPLSNCPSLPESLRVDTPTCTKKKVESPSSVPIMTPVLSTQGGSRVVVGPGSKTWLDDDDNSINKEVASFLHLSFSWGSSMFGSGLSSLGLGKHYLEDDSNPLGQGGAHNNANESTSLLIDATRSGPVGYPRGQAPSLPKGASVLELCSGDDFAAGMPVYSLDGNLPERYLLFSRPSSRHSPVLRPVEEVQEILRGMNIPYFEELESPSVDPVELFNRYGSSVYVFACLNIFLRYNFSWRFGFNVERLHRFYTTAATYIRSRNPFHNAIHAFDIVVATHQYLMQPYLAENFSDEELFGLLFASSVMKLGHIGASNSFLTEAHHPYATTQSYLSPLQSVSVSLAFALLDTPECCFLTFASPNKTESPSVTSVWTREMDTALHETVAKLVMATDERNHETLFSELGKMLGEGAGTVVRDSHIMPLMQNVLHAADFCYVIRRQSVYAYAAARAVAEVYRQDHVFRSLASGNITRLWRHGFHFLPAADTKEEAAPPASLVPASVVERVRSLRGARSSDQVGPLSFLSDSSGSPATSELTATPRGPTAGDGAPVPHSEHYAKKMQLAVLEELFLPYIRAMTPFVPQWWLTNAQQNLAWLREYSADSFEDDVSAVLYRPELVDSALQMCTDGLERRVLRCIVGSFLDNDGVPPAGLPPSSEEPTRE